MKIITSKDNRIYKQCQALMSKKHRDKLGLYIVEGEKLVYEAYKAGIVESIIYDANYEKGIHYQGVDIVFMMGKLFEKLAQTKTSQGVIAIVKKYNYNKDAFIKAITKGNGNVVVLDRLQDPGNIGTIIRTADAALYSGIIAIKGTGDIYSMKVVRAAAGSVMRVPVYLAEDEKEVIEILKESNKKLVGTAFDTENYYYQVDMSSDTAIIIGNEGSGMSQYLKENTDINVKIPMNPNVDSLNASVAAGILIYQSIKEC